MNRLIMRLYGYLIRSIAIFFAIVAISTPIYAQSEYTTNHQVHYEIHESGKTAVTQKINLTNQLSKLFATDYTIQIASGDIDEITAFDKIGSIKPKIRQNDETTEITLSFNDHVVGLGKSMPFTLKYETGDIAIKNGHIWEVFIPGIKKTPDINSYSVTFKVPKSFGNPTYISPKPKSNNSWGLENMVKGGINVVYGQAQYFRLDLTYYLENTSFVESLKEISLPPETAFQNISIVNINP